MYQNFRSSWGCHLGRKGGGGGRGGFKEKGLVSSLRWALQWHKISILVDPKQISVVSKRALQPDLLAQLLGALIYLEGPCEQYFKGLVSSCWHCWLLNLPRGGAFIKAVSHRGVVVLCDSYFGYNKNVCIVRLKSSFLYLFCPKILWKLHISMTLKQCSLFVSYSRG